jgi:prolyl oligopeptidase
MKLNITVVLFLSSISLFAKTQYPDAKRIECIDEYFGVKVNDPYRWMEDLNCNETKQWIEEQNKTTKACLEDLPLHKKIKDQITDVFNYPTESAPKKLNGKIYSWKNSGLQEQAVFYIQEDKENAQPEVLLDPNQFSENGTVALHSVKLSKGGKYLAYSISRNGTDFEEVYVIDLSTRKLLDDHVKWVKFSGISWNGDEGFYYSRYPEPKNDFDKAPLENKKSFYHKVGTSTKDDSLVFENQKDPKAHFNVGTTEDNKHLILSQHKGSGSGNSLHIKDLTQKDSNFRPIFPEISNGESHSVVASQGSTIFIHTNQNAPRNKVVSYNLAADKGKEWTTIIPEQDDILCDAFLVENKLLLTYMHNVCSKLKVCSLSGEEENIIDLPTLGEASGFGGKSDDKEIYFNFESFAYPPTIFKYTVATKELSVYKKSAAKFDGSQFKTEQIFYTSFDGTKVPMFVTYKKDIKLDGSAPALLTAYGSHGVVSHPSFGISRLIYLENGGIHAVANIRGGGEFGKEWHDAAKCLTKHISTLDFIAAADALVEKNFTSKNKLGITGGSSGGRLVAEAINLRPDLCKVCIPIVGTMDMLRFPKFTIGYAWMDEYGNPEKEAELQCLLKTSPLHNIKENGNYPAVLVIATDHDDRVYPAHSYKYTAELQAKNKDNANPLLIKVKTKQGHGTSQLSQAIEHATDVYTFWLSQVN